MATKKEDIEIKVANDDTRIEKVDQVLPPIALLENSLQVKKRQS